MSQCVIRYRGKQVTVMACSANKRRIRDVLNACYQVAHPTQEECRVVRDDVPVLGATKAIGKRRPHDAATQFENGWSVRTRWDAGDKEWVTVVSNDQGDVVDVRSARHSRQAEGTHGDAVAAVELYAEPGMDERAFLRARSGQEKLDLVSTAAALAPLSGRRRRRHRRR